MTIFLSRPILDLLSVMETHKITQIFIILGISKGRHTMTTAAPVKSGKWLIIPKDQNPEEGQRLCEEFRRRHQVSEVVTEPSPVTGAFTVNAAPDDPVSLQSIVIFVRGHGASVWANDKAPD
jgi:hypothetical protein